MATGVSRKKKQAKPAELRALNHLTESRQMGQHRLTEDSSSEPLIVPGGDAQNWLVVEEDCENLTSFETKDNSWRVVPLRPLSRGASKAL